MDDIVILGSTQLQVEYAATALIDFLSKLGIQVNNEKSMKPAAEQFHYLGQTIKLTTGMISTPASKLKQALTLAKKQLKARTCVPRHLARLAGALLDLQKGVQNLLGIPKLLMTDTAKAVAHNQLTIKSVQRAWSTLTHKPTTTAGIISQVIEALAHRVPVRASPHDGPRYIMETDANDARWRATMYRVTEARAPKDILAAALRWTPAERQLHITMEEALAATYGVTFLVPRLHAVSAITLQSDSTPTVWAWRNGSG